LKETVGEFAKRVTPHIWNTALGFALTT